MKESLIASAYDNKNQEGTILAARRLFLLAVTDYSPKVVDDLFKKCLGAARNNRDHSREGGDAIDSPEAESEIPATYAELRTLLITWSRACNFESEDQWILEQANVALRIFLQEEPHLDYLQAWRHAADVLQFSSSLKAAAPDAPVFKWLMGDEQLESPPLPDGLPSPINELGEVESETEYISRVLSESRERLKTQKASIEQIREALELAREEAEKYHHRYEKYLRKNEYAPARKSSSHELHSEWLVRYLAGQTYSKIANLSIDAGKTGENGIDTSTVKKGVARLAKFIGVILPANAQRTRAGRTK